MISWCHGIYMVFVYQIQAKVIIIIIIYVVIVIINICAGKQNLESRTPPSWELTPHQWAMESQCFKDITFS